VGPVDTEVVDQSELGIPDHALAQGMAMSVMNIRVDLAGDIPLLEERSRLFEEGKRFVEERNQLFEEGKRLFEKGTQFVEERIQSDVDKVGEEWLDHSCVVVVGNCLEDMHQLLDKQLTHSVPEAVHSDPSFLE
jgi:hypothetical protein